MPSEARLRIGIVLTLVLSVASLVVHSADRPADAMSVASPDGAAVFTARGCSGCHTVDGSGGGFAPDLTNLAARAGNRVEGLDAEAYVRQSIRDPQAFRASGFNGVQMPALQLSETEIDAVVRFLLDN